MFSYVMSEGESIKRPADIRRGRGAVSNASGRFEAEARVSVDDGWPADNARPPLRTTVTEDKSRSILARNTSPDIGFDRSINPYRGCEHGCIYCFARPTHAYLGLSPGLDFETQLFVKPDAARLLDATLRRPTYRPATIAIGTNTDPYQPIEQRYRIMAQVLDVLWAFRHPVTIVTKGALIQRDVPRLGAMAGAGLAHVGISLTTLDPGLSRRMEPRGAAPAHRLKAIEALAAAGVPVRAMIAPVIPGLTDHELDALVQAAADAGAQAASYILLRLPLEVAPLFQEWLAEAVPGRAAAVMTRLRDMRGGRDYDAQWGKRMRGQGVTAELLARRFDLARRRAGLAEELPSLRTDLFRPPLAKGDQLSLFEE